MWKGSFTPYLVKHRDYCGDITNHVGINDMQPTIDPETGTGILEVSFNDGDEEVYEFVITQAVVNEARRRLERDGEKEARRYLAEWCQREMQRLRDEAEGDADPYDR